MRLHQELNIINSQDPVVDPEIVFFFSSLSHSRNYTPFLLASLYTLRKMDHTLVLWMITSAGFLKWLEPFKKRKPPFIGFSKEPLRVIRFIMN